MELFNYLLKVSACSALFFAFYLLVLRKLTFFKINRFYLLVSLLISFIIPAMELTIEREVVQSSIVAEPSVVQDVDLTSSGAQTLSSSLDGNIEGVDLLLLLPYLYGMVVISLLFMAVRHIFQLLKHTKESVKEINGLKLVTKEKGFTNCSFFNYVFIDDNCLTESELAVLLVHEEVHAKQFHSIDKLILALAKAILWFNPIVYLYDKALEQAHEYEADEATSQNVGTENYANLLLQLAVSKSSNPLSHNFVKSPIKERIKMLFNSKSKNMKKLAYLLALPLGLCLIWSFTIKMVYAEPSIKKAANLTVKKSPLVKTSTTNPVEKNTVDVISLKPEAVVDTLRLVGSSSLGKNPKVIIDGVSYAPGILTKISPKSIKSTMTMPNQITITTKNNKIEYATKIDIENFKVQQRVNNNQLYVKYSQRRENGERYEIVKVNNVNGSAAMEVPYRSKVLILIGNTKYTEAQAKAMGKTAATNGVNIIERTMPGFATQFAQYVGKYDVVVTIPETTQPDPNETSLLIEDGKIIMLLTKSTNLEQILSYKKRLKEKNIDLDIVKITYTNEKKIKDLEISVNCNDGFRGSYGADLSKGEKCGFYRIYDKSISSPFGMTSTPYDKEQ